MRLDNCLAQRGGLANILSNLKEHLYEHYLSTHFGGIRSADPDALESYARHYCTVYGPLLPADKGAPILEVGCGMGHFLYFLQAQGYVNHWGIDIGKEQINHCREHVTQQVSLVSDTASYLLERKGQYHAIVFLDVLEHLEDDNLWEILGGAKEALVPGGKVIVSVPNAACITSLMTLYGDLTHRRLFTEGSLGQLFRTLGYTNIEMLPNEKKVIRSFRSRRERWLWQLRDRFVRWLLANFYQHLMEGAIPYVQTINLIGVGVRPVALNGQEGSSTPCNV